MADEAVNTEEKKKKEKADLDKRTEEEHKKLPEEKKVEPKKETVEPKKTTLMDKIFDFSYHAAMAVGTTALGLATAGTAAPIIGGAFAGSTLLGSFFSKKKKLSLYERILSAMRTYSVVNAILHPMVYLGDITYPLINNATLLGKAARALYGSTLYMAAFLTAFKTGDHLVKNKFDFKDIGRSIKDNWWPMYKRFAVGFFPGIALTANGVNTIPIKGYNADVFALNALPLGFYNGINPPGLKEKKKEEKKQAQPAYPQIPQGYQPAPG